MANQWTKCAIFQFANRYQRVPSSRRPPMLPANGKQLSQGHLGEQKTGSVNTSALMYYLCVYIYTHTYACVCVYVCVYTVAIGILCVDVYIYIYTHVNIGKNIPNWDLWGIPGSLGWCKMTPKWLVHGMVYYWILRHDMTIYETVNIKLRYIIYIYIKYIPCHVVPI